MGNIQYLLIVVITFGLLNDRYWLFPRRASIYIFGNLILHRLLYKLPYYIAQLYSWRYWLTHYGYDGTSVFGSYWEKANGRHPDEY